MTRVVCLVDGFNLYHSLHELRQPWLKWLDLWALSERLVRPRSEQLVAVYYFSAFAQWLPEAHRRHQAYVKGLEAHRVTAVMGHFKTKRRRCKGCRTQWKAHEEKETDVNIAVAMLRLAYQDAFDRCLLVTRDSDLAPAVRAVRQDFPHKTVTVVAPPNRGHSSELLSAANGEKAKISVRQLETCQLPDAVIDAGGNTVAQRPSTYAPD